LIAILWQLLDVKYFIFGCTIFERFWDGGLIILADLQFLRGFGMVG
jgi:hypothetical protein